MPKTDDGFQGFRPAVFGDIWDRMTSTQRRKACKYDIILGFGGAAMVYLLVDWALR